MIELVIQSHYLHFQTQSFIKNSTVFLSCEHNSSRTLRSSAPPVVRPQRQMETTEHVCYRGAEENGAGLAAHSCFGVDYELSLILKEIRVITDQVFIRSKYVHMT